MMLEGILRGLLLIAISAFWGAHLIAIGVSFATAAPIFLFLLLMTNVPRYFGSLMQRILPRKSEEISNAISTFGWALVTAVALIFIVEVCLGVYALKWG